MYKTVLLIALFSFCFNNMYAQSTSNKPLIEEYLKQSERQKKTGLIMLGAGVGSTLIGTLLVANSFSSGSGASGYSGVFLFTAWTLSTLISIPVIISSAYKARKAAKLSVGAQGFEGIRLDSNNQIIFPTLKLSIPIHPNL
jgi:uncharacterized membrane protein YkgB